MKKSEVRLSKKISIKNFIIIFFGFFIFEYGLPIYNTFVAAANSEVITLMQLLQETQIIKHFIRFPVYFVMYAATFYFFFQKKNYLSYQLLRLFLYMHLIFTALGKGMLVVVLREQISLFFPITFILLTAVVYFFSILYIDDYKKRHFKKEE